MGTDLTAVHDHPAVLLDREAVTFAAEGATITVESFRRSATRLRSYEQDHGVTFAALDNDALAYVRHTYDAATSRMSTGEDVADFVGAVRDLLGLGE
jgi:hypothetical protein